MADTCVTPRVESTPMISSSKYRSRTYHIISRVCYLAGVPKCMFEREAEPPQLEIYNQLNTNKDARVIRNLCMIRSAIMLNFSIIQTQIIYNLKNLSTLPEYIPGVCLEELQADGLPVEKANCKPNTYLLNLNQEIALRINRCRDMFPIWIEWDYIRSLFIMPKGNREKYVAKCGREFSGRRRFYPYQVYLNWYCPYNGNVLHSDEKFLRLLYESNGTEFLDIDKVTDVKESTKRNIYTFLKNSGHTTIVVDCENSDPFKLYAALRNLNKEALLDKIHKIILYDDVHTTSAWGILERFTGIPVEHKVIPRLKEQKSLVDISLAAGVCKEFYENRTDSFILLSSDSDYWGLISAMPQARFFVMLEFLKCSAKTRNTFREHQIGYCYIDDFCQGNADEIRISVILDEMQKIVSEKSTMNMEDILQKAIQNSRVTLSSAEKSQFWDRYIKPMHVKLDQDGNASIVLGR